MTLVTNFFFLSPIRLLSSFCLLKLQRNEYTERKRLEGFYFGVLKRFYGGEFFQNQ